MGRSTALIDDRGTTPEVFEPIAERFGGFSIDVAAAAHNAKCERYFSIEDDGLKQSWAGERVWCNPPYSAIEPWVAKAHLETAAPLVVMLLPANRCEQGWWQRQVEPYRLAGDVRVEFLPGRLRFLKPGQKHIGPNERPPFGCCLLIWERNVNEQEAEPLSSRPFLAAQPAMSRSLGSTGPCRRYG